jgi:hypothetical protein
VKLLSDRGPLILTCQQRIPIFLGLFPQHKPMQRGDVQNDAVVEVGVEVKVGRPSELVLEISQFGEEVFRLNSKLG